MPVEWAIALAVIVGCVAFGGGVVLTSIVWAVVSWLRSDDEPSGEPGYVDQAAREAEERIAAVHRQAHEMLATTVMRGTADDAELDALLRADRRGGQEGQTT